MDLVFSQAGVLGSDLPPGITPKEHFHCHRFKEAGVIWQWRLSPFGGFSITPGLLWVSHLQDSALAEQLQKCSHLPPFPMISSMRKRLIGERRKCEESVCVLVLICWKRGLWEPFLGYGNVMNEISWRKQLLQSSQWTAWLVPLFLQYVFFQMVLHLSCLSFIMFFSYFPFLPSLSLFLFHFSWFILYRSHYSKNNYQGGKKSAYG